MVTKYVCPNCKSFIEFDGKAAVVCSKCKIKMFSNEDRKNKESPKHLNIK